MKNLLTLPHLSSDEPGNAGGPPELHLRAVSDRSGVELLPGLMEAIDRASGWVLHRQMVSASALQLRLEAQGRVLMDLYASLIEEGLDLSRESHRLLAERCSCARLSSQCRRSIVSLSLDVSLATEPPLPTHWDRSRTA